MLMAVYGTLRKGSSNHHKIAAATYRAQERLVGYKMLHNGSYPYAVPSSDNDTILAELYETPAELAMPIINMELRAGYEMTGVPTSIGTAVLFTHDDRPELTRITRGDWIEWLKKYQPARYDEREEITQ